MCLVSGFRFWYSNACTSFRHKMTKKQVEPMGLLTFCFRCATPVVRYIPEQVSSKACQSHKLLSFKNKKMFPSPKARESSTTKET